MGTKVAVAFANIILAKVETELLNKKSYKAKRCIDDGHRKRANNTLHNHHDNSVINVNLNKFREEISEDQISFLDTIVYKEE